MIGLTCAIIDEFDAIRGLLAEPIEKETPGEYHILEGGFEDTRIVVICHGTGKAAAAASAQILLERYSPDALINFGTAGALVEDLHIGDTVVADRLYQGDFGVVHGGGFGHTGASLMIDREAFNAREYEPDSEMIGAARTVADRAPALEGEGAIRFGPVVSCDQVILSREFREGLNQAFGALVVEMEGASVAHVAAMNRCPFAVVRAVSDTVDVDIERFEELLRYLGESRTACWSRRARFAAANPNAVRKISSLMRGLKEAARNAATLACEIAGEYSDND